MNDKYAHAMRHSLASLVGWTRLFCIQPKFARELLHRRWRYFARRQFTPGFATPEGFILPTPDSLVGYWSMFVERELYSRDWVQSLEAAQQPLVVDVGANAGLFSLLAFNINPKAEIVAFEPLPVLIQHINAMKQRTGANLRCIPKAAGRSLGTAHLESPHGYDGTSFVSLSSKPSGQTLAVEVTTLDKELAGREVLVMKVDVEGFEDEVIAGGQETLSQTKFLILEAQDVARRDHLTGLLGPKWQRQKLGSSDYLFIRI